MDYQEREDAIYAKIPLAFFIKFVFMRGGRKFTVLSYCMLLVT
jgi:hypothetical protein